MAKSCGKCGDSKDESEFFKNVRNSDGYHIYCKSCDYLRKQKYRRLSDEQRAQKKFIASQKKKQKAKEYRTANRDKCVSATKSWYERNKDYSKDKNKQYRAINKEKIAAQASQRRAKIRGASMDLDASYKTEIEGLYLFAKLFGGHVDHIVPLNNNVVCGLHVPWNMQVISPKENMSKQGKFDVIKYPEQGMLSFV